MSLELRGTRESCPICPVQGSRGQSHNGRSNTLGIRQSAALYTHFVDSGWTLVQASSGSR